MKIEGKFILKVAGTLTAISLVVAALLGATNALTEDKIAAINKANTEVALAAVVSSPDCEFPPLRRSRRPPLTPPRCRAASSPRPTASS